MLPAIVFRAFQPSRPLAAAALAILFAALGLLLISIGAPARAAERADWDTRLRSALERVDDGHPARIGVYVRDLDGQAEFGYDAERAWYLASMVKVPVAIAVLQAVERGDFTLETPLTVRTADYVDGAGGTNHHAPGDAVTVGWLIEQMIIHSDNTASDMLIGLVGIRAVNEAVQAQVPEGFGPITSLVDVRRQVYGRLAPAAQHLTGLDFLELKKQRSDADRLRLLSRLTATPTSQFHLPTLVDAYDAYYATGVNSGRLDAYGSLLARLARGEALGPAGTSYLLGVMSRTQTGQQRLKAGLPRHVRFAHKTGTQRARICDAGIATAARAVGPRRYVIVACAAGDPSLARSELALKQVGEALCRSGLMTTGGKPDETLCTAGPARRGSDPAKAPARDSGDAGGDVAPGETAGNGGSDMAPGEAAGNGGSDGAPAEGGDGGGGNDAGRAGDRAAGPGADGPR